ncbi:MAG: endonuclease III, partial [Candidatus Bathyarchaeota archaeon]
KNLKKTGQLLVEKYDSHVPRKLEELIKLPGVARKTANIVLSNAFGIVEGIAVDTHVRRLSQRLGLTKNNNPDKIEKDLMQIIPKSNWEKITDLLIFHGRNVCTARKPKCKICVLNKICPSAFKV